MQAQNFFKSAGALQRQVSARMQEQAGEFGKQYFKLKYTLSLSFSLFRFHLTCALGGMLGACFSEWARKPSVLTPRTCQSRWTTPSTQRKTVSFFLLPCSLAHSPCVSLFLPASALRAAANAADYPTLAYIDLIVAPTASGTPFFFDTARIFPRPSPFSFPLSQRWNRTCLLSSLICWLFRR